VLGTGVMSVINFSGSGPIGYIDYLDIVNADNDCVLKFYCTGSGGVGRIGSTWNDDPAETKTISPAGDGVFKMTVGDLKALGIETTEQIIINVWTGTLTKIELCVAPPPPPAELVIYDLNSGGLLTGVTLRAGFDAVIDTDGIKLSPASGTVNYECFIDFDDDIDITEYTTITIEWSGVYSPNGGYTLNMFNINFFVLFSDSQKVAHQFAINTSPATNEFEANAVTWDQSWDDVDKETCIGFRIVSDYQQKTDGISWPQLVAGEPEDLIITKIVLQ